MLKGEDLLKDGRESGSNEMRIVTTRKGHYTISYGGRTKRLETRLNYAARQIF